MIDLLHADLARVFARAERLNRANGCAKIEVPPRRWNDRGRGTRSLEDRMHVQSILPFPAPEEWRAVPGYDGRYEVSDHGRVRSLWFRNSTVDRKRVTPVILRLRLTPRGYLRVGLGHGQRGTTTHWFVHRLVLTAFVGPPPAGSETSHLNGRPADNRLVNLRWEAHVENMQRQVEHGTKSVGERHGMRLHPERAARGDRSPARLHPDSLARGDRHGARLHPETRARGEAHGQSKLTAEQVIAIRAASAGGESLRSIARRFGVSKNGVQHIVARRTWRHL